ncbi:hypothetical protein BCD67_16470 [Oscillatoriales cyanobacterium USR001]|nr:hypothetical protein BCD67_16470 [Oscillatoriales cyanobacterium USR001]
MSYCINPNCRHPENPLDISFCQSCGSQLLIEGRYWVQKPLGKGGFGVTYEVKEGEITKVLKLLTYNDVTGVRLFQQEAHVLMKLRHPGLPVVEPNGYFTFTPKNSQSPLHCLVMEKIAGMNLQEWIKHRNHQTIENDLAIDWLEQLGRILHLVHSQNYFHRDIKPQNIMIRPNGQLVLIDFGAVREVTESIERKSGHITRIFSQGYTPPEQTNGNAEPRSDFFALGRNFVYLLTGQEPSYLEQNSPPGKFMWRSLAPQISKQLGDLIDDMMNNSVNVRPQDTLVLLQRITQLKAPSKHPQKANFPLAPKKFLIAGGVAGVAVAIAIAVAAFVPKFIPQTAPEKLLTYENSQHGFKIKYPDRWQAQELENTVISDVVKLQPPKKSDVDINSGDVVVTVEDFKAKPMSMEEFTEASHKQIKSSIENVEILEDGSAMLANTKAHKIVFMAKDEENNVKTMQVWTVKNNRAYIITYKAKQESFLDNLSSAEKIISSLEIN